MTSSNEYFKATVLDFAGDLQWVQYGEGGERVEFLANRTREGTFPPGSQWSRNPIPACTGADGGYMQPNYNCDTGTQFPPPAPGLFGYGENVYAPGAPSFKWSLMDEVWIPEDMEPGAYTLSFRSYLLTFSCSENQKMVALPLGLYSVKIIKKCLQTVLTHDQSV